MRKKKITANVYMTNKVKYTKEGICFEHDPNGYLFAYGRYRTKILPEDLSEWYVAGYMYKRHGYISAKGVQHLIYKPNYSFSNHLHKYDTLLISYNEKIEPYKDEHSFSWYKGYDDALGGNCLVEFVKAAGGSIQVMMLMRFKRKLKKRGSGTMSETQSTDQKIDCTLTRQKRKSLVIQVKNGGVEIRAPLRASNYEIKEFLESKQKWILQRLELKAERAMKKAAFKVNYGSRIPYRGKDYLVGGVPDRKPFFENIFCVPVHLMPEKIKAACIRVYRELAKKDLTSKVQDFASKMSVKPSSIKINGAKSRWGSCSAKRGLNFSWRVVMADDEIIDYIVVHELAHIKEWNHSSRFWAIVESILPDYEQRKRHLKELQQKLIFEDWEIKK